ncbi:MAG: hypothetical protein MR009_10505 [Sutterellaceae bacterium]|nr:hypothetical protein [Sutterellaceae bacterium]MDD7441864.1 hypothetical protein [Sutterellaceae bacterium]MDY2867714.1 hypothetical protein [Mesosutterella sp.]
MTFRSIGVLILFLASILFTIVNWGSVMAPMPVSFILFTVNAPFGLLLIVGGGLVFLLSLLWMLWKEARSLVDLQKANREAREARATAESAENSRVAKLEEAMKEGFAKLEQASQAQPAAAPGGNEALPAVPQPAEDMRKEAAELKAEIEKANAALARIEEKLSERLI